MVLGKRLEAVAGKVRQGAVLADVGTDHGKLPVFLAATGRIKGAVASDINEKPLKKAEINIERYGVSGVVRTFLTDGLKGIEKFCPTDIVIAGMGGELTSEILDNSGMDKKGIRFIFQPMTKADELRKYLCSNGYEITGEELVREKKIYQIICAEYTGKNTEMTEAEYLVGKRENRRGDGGLTRDFLKREREKIERIISEKQRAGADCSKEESILSGIKKEEIRK